MDIKCTTDLAGFTMSSRYDVAALRRIVAKFSGLQIDGRGLFAGKQKAFLCALMLQLYGRFVQMNKSYFGAWAALRENRQTDSERERYLVISITRMNFEQVVGMGIRIKAIKLNDSKLFDNSL